MAPYQCLLFGGSTPLLGYGRAILYDGYHIRLFKLPVAPGESSAVAFVTGNRLMLDLRREVN